MKKAVIIIINVILMIHNFSYAFSIKVKANKEIYNLNDIIKIGLSVNSTDMPNYNEFSLYLRFNKDHNPYKDLFNKFITINGIYDFMEPMFNETYPIEYFQLDCISHPDQPCLFEFPANSLPGGSYNLTFFLASPIDPLKTAVSDNLTFIIVEDIFQTLKGKWQIVGYTSNQTEILNGIATFKEDYSFEIIQTYKNGLKQIINGEWKYKKDNKELILIPEKEKVSWGSISITCWVENWPSGLCDNGETTEFFLSQGKVEIGAKEFYLVQKNEREYIVYFKKQ